jgi:hypothetical protein
MRHSVTLDDAAQRLIERGNQLAQMRQVEIVSTVVFSHLFLIFLIKKL